MALISSYVLMSLVTRLLDDCQPCPRQYRRGSGRSTTERADLRKGAASAGWYYRFDPTGQAVKKDSDMYKALDVLAAQVWYCFSPLSAHRS
jgi:hypothetical protein